MPEIKFFARSVLGPDHSRVSETFPHTSLMLGNWRFMLASREPLRDGYEETYTNPFITQEETDRLWDKYLAETGQNVRNEV